MPVPVNSVQATVVSAGGTSLPTSVIAFATTDVQVERQQVDETFVIMANPAEYTASISPVNQQVTITLAEATTDVTYRVSNAAALAQLSDYTLADYSPQRLTRDLDKIYLQLQRLALAQAAVGEEGSSAEWGSDFDLPQDGTDIAPALTTLMEERQLAGIRTTRYVPRQGEPDPYINSFLKVPAGHTFDRSQVSFRRGKLARIGMSGSLVELPETGKYRLVNAVAAGATTIYLRVVTGGSLTALQDAETAGMDLVIRGQNDASGNSIERETIPFTIIDDSNDQNIEVSLGRPTENAYEVVYADSDWEPNGPASDYSLVSVTVGGVVDEAIADGDIEIELVSVPAAMVAGSTVLLTSDELVPSGTSTLPFGREVHRVRSVDGTTVTLMEPVTRDFPLVENPKLLLREAFEGATILCGHRNDTWLEAPDAAPASRIDAYTMQYVDDCTIIEPWVDDEATTYYIRGSGVMDREGYNNRVVDARIFRRTGGGSGDHNGLGRFYSTFSRDERSFVVGARHGILNQGGISPGTFDYGAVDCATNAWDTHGCGTVGAILDGFEIVGGSSLSSDNADQRGIDLGNTSHRSSDRRTTIRNGTIRGLNATSGSAGLTVRPPSEDVVIQNVHFVDCATGLRMIIDDRAGPINIDGVTVQGATYTDCDADTDTAQTDAPAWVTGEAIVGTSARPRYRTANGGLWSATTSFTTGATEPTGTGPTHDDDNGIWTYVTTAANRILNARLEADAQLFDPADSGLVSVTTGAALRELSDTLGTEVTALQAAIDALTGITLSLDSTLITPDPTLNVLVLADLALDVAGQSVKERLVRLLNTTPSTAMTARLPKAGVPGQTKFTLVVTPDQTGGVSLDVEDAVADGGRINGSSSPIAVVLPPAGTVRIFAVICYENVGGSAAKYMTVGLPTATIDAGIINPVLTASGALTAAVHSGRTVVTSGNVTVPVVDGFACTIIAGGSHTVGAGGATEALTVGQAITVICDGTTVYFTPIITLDTLPTS